MASDGAGLSDARALKRFEEIGAGDWTARIDSNWDPFIFENEQVLSELGSVESEVNQIFGRKISPYDPK